MGPGSEAQSSSSIHDVGPSSDGSTARPDGRASRRTMEWRAHPASGSSSWTPAGHVCGRQPPSRLVRPVACRVRGVGDGPARQSREGDEERTERTAGERVHARHSPPPVKAPGSVGGARRSDVRHCGTHDRTPRLHPVRRSAAGAPPRNRATTSATSPSSPTSTTARPRSSTRCCARPARSGPTRHVVDRVLDSGDLEREKGITILAKQTTVDYDGVRLNIVDTPGHADFGGEVERVAADGRQRAAARRRGGGAAAPDPLRPPEGDGAPPPGRRRASTRSTAATPAPAEVLDEVYELFIDLGADEHQIEFPIVYTNAKAGTATPRPGRCPARTCGRSSTCSSRSPRRRPSTPGHPLQLLVTNLSANEYVGRMAVGRIWNGDDPDRPADHRRPRGGRRHGRHGRARPDGHADRHRHQPPDRPRHRPGRDRGGLGRGHRVGRRAARGDDRRHPDRPGRSAAAAAARRRRADPADDLRGQHVAARRAARASYVTSRQIKARLDREVLGNVSIEVRPTESGETFEVRGRGELQLAVLIEQMRREGFELTGRRPRSSCARSAARRPGAVRADHDRHPARLHRRRSRQALAGRKAPARADDDRRRRPRPDGVRPARPRAHRLSRPAADRHPRDGAAAPDRRGLRAVGRRGHPPDHRASSWPTATGTSNAYGLFNLQERAELFIGSGVEVYEGMVVGENARSGDMDVNATKEKKLTNIRTHSHDEALRLTPPRPLTLEIGARVHRRRRAGRGDPAVDPAPQARSSPSTTGGASAAGEATSSARQSDDEPGRPAQPLAVAQRARPLRVASPCGAGRSPTSGTGARRRRCASRSASSGGPARS